MKTIDGFHSQKKSLRRLTMHTLVGFLSCHDGTAFVPAAIRLGGGMSAIRSTTSRLTFPARRSPPGMTTSDGGLQHDDKQTGEAKTSAWSGACRTAATCLATAAILSSSLPAGAASGSGGGTHDLDGGRGSSSANVFMVLADEGDFSSADGRADVSQLVLELKKADRPDTLLNSMVKINDVVDGDEDGVLENPFAAESIVKGLIDKRRAGGEAWDSNTETAFGILKRKLDPFNVVLLRPYLKIAPFLGGAYYLAAFFVQQKFRGFFPYAYFGAVAVFVAPALIVILAN
ncbi:unnamed protein product [Ectocarpus sp. 4 AP-2014]